MMAIEDIKTFLFYLIGLGSLIGASLLFANQGEPLEISPLPTVIPPTIVSQAATRSTVVEPAECTDTVRGMVFNDVPDASTATNSDNDPLFIAGTIYASDGTTPLAGAMIEAWEEAARDELSGLVLLTQTQTSATGRYTVTTVNPYGHGRIKVPYRVSYQDKCCLSMDMAMMNLSISPTRTKRAKEVGRARPVFQGPVDLILPVRPPSP